jgi:Protein of unknown function (DUF3224)
MNPKLRAAFLLLLPISVLSLRAAQKETPMPHHATGPFEVKLIPLDPAFKADDNSIGRYSLDKQFHGALEASSKGEMLSGGGTVKGSGGYVAIERVTGTLDGRTGTFILQHNGTMQNGVYHLNVIVVPDSGTAQLTGLQGSMEIIIKDGKHSYDFSYTLP